MLFSGYEKNSVQPKKSEIEYHRLFATKSGLKRNKRFGGQLEQDVQTEFSSSPICLVSSSPLPTTDSLCNHMDSRNTSGNLCDDGNDGMLSIKCSGAAEYNHAMSSSQVLLHTNNNVLRRLVAEELKIGERRRILFCERPVGSILGRSQSCPYTTEEIFPLRFREFRKSIRTHILLVYEWLRSWPDYDSFTKFDQITFLRKCVLYHTILDPSYITLQIGYPSRFVMQNGGFLAVHENCKEGWEDEKEISSTTKQKYF
ncbi:hypothetical protein LOAG_00329 [Loa loa]|uniref:NR LBD domain-containing protein n=1 Tax=Loa loa TaxID=7209 RepID=A0A1S0UBP3_LOALO|nr:hypothetical protein LOAG_00329 [Loa loa]EFO28149.2 hypothetical protein LOAG_00329 [Loa loa]